MNRAETIFKLIIYVLIKLEMKNVKKNSEVSKQWEKDEFLIGHWLKVLACA